MFRRAERNENETDFDTESAAQGTFLGGAEESAKVITPTQASSYTPAQQPASAQPAYNPTAAYTPPQSVNRPSTMESPAVRPATPASAAPAYRPQPAEAPRARMPESKPVSYGMTASSASTSVAPAPSGPMTQASMKESRRVLTVGADILLKGEIATCDRLVIEGKVDATLNDVHTVELAESGSFKGTAQVEYAEISGLFEGDLVVKNRLVIYASGKVRGRVTYGEIEIERGGEMTGEIKTFNTPASASTTRTTSRMKEDKVAA